MAQLKTILQANILPKAAIYDVCSCFKKYTLQSLPIHNHLNNLNHELQIARKKTVSFKKEGAGDVKLRFLHASPNAPNIDIYVNHKRVFAGLPYKQVSTQLAFPHGKYLLQIYPAGSISNAILCEKIITDRGIAYTIAIVGKYKELQLFSFADSAEVPGCEAKARFIHLAPDTPAVDLAVKNRDVVFPQVSYKQISEYLGLTPMTIDLEVRRAGSKEILLPIPKIQFKADHAYSVAFVGFSNMDPAAEVIVLKD